VKTVNQSSCVTVNYKECRFEVSTAVTMMIIIFWEIATRRHLPEDDNHYKECRLAIALYCL
jgi:hypothetical protein